MRNNLPSFVWLARCPFPVSSCPFHCYSYIVVSRTHSENVNENNFAALQEIDHKCMSTVHTIPVVYHPSEVPQVMLLYLSCFSLVFSFVVLSSSVIFFYSSCFSLVFSFVVLSSSDLFKKYDCWKLKNEPSWSDRNDYIYQDRPIGTLMLRQVCFQRWSSENLPLCPHSAYMITLQLKLLQENFGSAEQCVIIEQIYDEICLLYYLII
jgi:hypothetical protein